MKRIIGLAALASLLAAGTAAASTSGTTVATTSGTTASTAVAGETPATGATGTTVALVDADPAPTRIVSLSPSATEDLYAVGAGAQVIAVDEYSNFPAETQKIQHDLSGYTPNVEAIAALKPDLVVHDGTTKLGEQLDSLGIKNLVAAAPADLDGTYAQIEQIGAATGHLADAVAVVAKMTTEIDAALAAATAATGVTYFHELDNTLYTVTSKTFIGQVYSMFGMTNVADALANGTDYPQLNAEALITANPQMIFLADAGFGESATTVAARAGWADIAAVKDGNVVALDGDIASRWGPRVVDLVKAVAAALAKLPVNA